MYYELTRVRNLNPRPPRNPRPRSSVAGELDQPEQPEATPGRTPIADPPPPRARKRYIGSAFSHDGVNFTPEDGSRLEDEEITDPEVVRMGDQWLMFLSREGETVLARSSDGMRFEMDEKFIVHAGEAAGAVAMPEGQVRLYVSQPDGIASLVYDPVSGAIKAEPGVRFAGECTDAAVCPKAAGGFVGAVRRKLNAPPPR
jgi:hypothetical protein